jgi:hypothetical protein
MLLWLKMGLCLYLVNPRMSSHLAKATKSASGKADEEESDKTDYDEDKDQLEGDTR